MVRPGTAAGRMLIRKIISALCWLACAVILIALTPIVALVFLLTAPFDPGRYATGLTFRLAPKLGTAVIPFWRFRVSGTLPPDPRRPYVIVSNHESYADVWLIGLLPWEMKWLAKDEIFRLPFQGWMMRMAGDVRVDRSSPNSRAQALEGLRDRLRKRVSVMVFPEGTRSPTDEMLPFRDGAFRLAIEEQVPVLPLVVSGTRNAMAKHSFVFNSARAEVRVLPPVETTGLTVADASALRRRVQDMIARARATASDPRAAPRPGP